MAHAFCMRQNTRASRRMSIGESCHDFGDFDDFGSRPRANHSSGSRLLQNMCRITNNKWNKISQSIKLTVVRKGILQNRNLSVLTNLYSNDKLLSTKREPLLYLKSSQGRNFTNLYCRRKYLNPKVESYWKYNMWQVSFYHQEGNVDVYR